MSSGRRTRKATIVARLDKKLARKRALEADVHALRDGKASSTTGDDRDIQTLPSNTAAVPGPSDEAILTTLFDRSRALSARMTDIALGKRGRWCILRRWKSLWCKRAVVNLKIRALKEKRWCNASSNTVAQTAVEGPTVPEKAKETSPEKQRAAIAQESASKCPNPPKTLAIRTLKVVRIGGPSASERRVVSLEKLEQIVRDAMLKKVVDNRLCVECPVCGQRTFPGHVREHLANHLRAEERPFRCPHDKCSTTATKLDIIQQHVATRHPHFLSGRERLLAPMCESERLDSCVRRLLKQRTIEGSRGFAQASLTGRRLLTDCPQPARQVFVQRPAPGKRHPPAANQNVVYRADGRPFVLKFQTAHHSSAMTTYVHGKGAPQRLVQSSVPPSNASQKCNALTTKQRVVYRIGPQGGVLQPGTAQQSGLRQRRTLRDTFLQWQQAVHHSEDHNEHHDSEKPEHYEQQRSQARQVILQHREQQHRNAELQGEQGDHLLVSEDFQRSTPAPQQYIVYHSGPKCGPPFEMLTPQPPSDAGLRSQAAQSVEQDPTVQWRMPPDSFAHWQLEKEHQLDHDYHQATHEHASYHPQHAQHEPATYENDRQQQQGVFERYRETVLAAHQY